MLGKWGSAQAGSGVLCRPGTLSPYNPGQSHSTPPGATFDISTSPLCQQIRLTRQRWSSEGKCLCFYFILSLSCFCNCNWTNRISHLSSPKAQGLKTGQDSIHISSLGTRFPLHQSPSALLWQPTKVLKGLEKVPCQLPSPRRAPGSHRAGTRPWTAVGASALREIPRGRAVVSFKTKV